MFKKKIITIASSLIIALSLFASESSMSSYVEGCKLYAEGDWTSATIMLKKAVAYPETLMTTFIICLSHPKYMMVMIKVH